MRRSLLRLRQPRRRSVYRGRIHLAYESLEQRRMLTTRIWDGGGGDDNWNTAANWDNDTLPIAGDDVVINDLGSGAFNVSVNVSPPNLASFTMTTSNATLQLSSVIMTVDGVANITDGNVEMSGSTWTGDATSSLALAGNTDVFSNSSISTNTFVQSGTMNIVANDVVKHHSHRQQRNDE